MPYLPSGPERPSTPVNMTTKTTYYFLTSLVLLHIVWLYLIQPRLELSHNTNETIEGIIVLLLVGTLAYHGYLRWQGK